jgi:hypothetical protein
LPNILIPYKIVPAKSRIYISAPIRSVKGRRTEATKASHTAFPYLAFMGREMAGQPMYPFRTLLISLVIRIHIPKATQATNVEKTWKLNVTCSLVSSLYIRTYNM